MKCGECDIKNYINENNNILLIRNEHLDCILVKAGIYFLFSTQMPMDLESVVLLPIQANCKCSGSLPKTGSVSKQERFLTMWCEEGGIEMLRYIAWSGQEICARSPFWVMQVNIKPPKSSWEGVILSKQWIHYHCQKSHMSYRCHQTSEMLISELPVWNGWHVLKMREEEKANNSPNLK